MRILVEEAKRDEEAELPKLNVTAWYDTRSNEFRGRGIASGGIDWVAATPFSLPRSGVAAQ